MNQTNNQTRALSISDRTAATKQVVFPAQVFPDPPDKLIQHTKLRERTR